jgi:hypothetical protein
MVTGEEMPVLIQGNQFISQVQITDSDLVQGCITKSLTPHNVQGQSIRPADVVLQYMAGLEQELSRLDEEAWNQAGMEREKIIANQMEPLEERLKGCKVYLQSIQNANWDAFELPKDRDLEASFVKILIDSHYYMEEVNRFVAGNTKSDEEAKPPSAKPKLSRSIHAQECSKKCREIAKRLWERQPDFTIAGMINRSEMVRQARQPDGKPYSEMTIRNWIRDLCPNRKPGRRPTKNGTSGRGAEFQSILK